MVAWTRDFHVFVSRVTTGFSAVFFSSRHIAQARYVRALLGLLIRHFVSVLSGFLLRSQHCDSRRNPVRSTNMSKFDGTNSM
jgi:hypothetical protein